MQFTIQHTVPFSQHYSHLKTRTILSELTPTSLIFDGAQQLEMQALYLRLYTTASVTNKTVTDVYFFHQSLHIRSKIVGKPSRPLISSRLSAPSMERTQSYHLIYYHIIFILYAPKSEKVSQAPDCKYDHVIN